MIVIQMRHRTTPLQLSNSGQSNVIFNIRAHGFANMVQDCQDLAHLQLHYNPSIYFNTDWIAGLRGIHKSNYGRGLPKSY